MKLHSFDLSVQNTNLHSVMSFSYSFQTLVHLHVLQSRLSVKIPLDSLLWEVLIFVDNMLHFDGISKIGWVQLVIHAYVWFRKLEPWTVVDHQQWKSYQHIITWIHLCEWSLGTWQLAERLWNAFSQTSGFHSTNSREKTARINTKQKSNKIEALLSACWLHLCWRYSGAIGTLI